MSVQANPSIVVWIVLAILLLAVAAAIVVQMVRL
jgi:hypothetical protein